MVEKVEVVRVGKSRRAKLYYLRDRVGKSAKTKENLAARIENKEITVKEDLLENEAEAPAEVENVDVKEETVEVKNEEVPVESAPEEAPAIKTENPVVEEVVDTVKEEKVDKVEE